MLAQVCFVQLFALVAPQHLSCKILILANKDMSMKIQVSVKTMEKGAATAKVEMTVTATETVKSVKEKVAAAQLIAFPELKDLLKSRDLTNDELGLLYCYKHGVSTNQALKTIGIEAKLADFIKD